MWAFCARRLMITSEFGPILSFVVSSNSISAADRLKEEQERGLTIELGFAPCLLQGDVCVGIVDVPGHEKFVRNMVAGVSGIDMTVLVVAADDGVMPQTIEHFQIMELVSGVPLRITTYAAAE